MVGFAEERVRQKVMQRTIPTIVSLSGCFSTWYVGVLELSCQGRARESGRYYVRKSHPEHKCDAELLGPRELKLEGLVDWKTDYHDIHGKVDDAVAKDELVDVETVTGLLGRPSGPGEVDRLTLEDDDEDEKDHDEDVEPDDRVRDAAEDGRCVKDAQEEEAHRELGGRDVDNVEHLVGEEGYQNRGDVGEGDFPHILAEPEVIDAPEVHSIECNGEGLFVWR